MLQARERARSWLVASMILFEYTPPMLSGIDEILGALVEMLQDP